MWGLPAPFPATHAHYGVILILAFTAVGALFVCDDGQLRFDELSHLRAEWRFNWNTHTWEDGDIGDFDDEGSDGGSEVPGDLPELDGPDRSDSGDEGDGAAGDVDTQ
jgi:hypothetical protein